jgi:DNA-binding GntR family transcriptional regulator
MSVVEGDGGSLAAVLAMDGSQVTQGGDRLDEADPRPLWRQLADLLRSRIERGELVGRLEAETALAQHYEISRDTVRRALACLAGDGLIRSTRGRGTFVLPPSERGS